MMKCGLLALLMAVATSISWAQTAPGDGPSHEVSQLNDLLLDVMQNAEALGYDGRYQRLAPELERLFDFPLMAKTSIGRGWDKLSADQQQSFAQAFTDLSIATFASRFSGFSGERFEVTGEAPGRSGTVLVQNRIVKSDGEPVEINYLARETDGQWRIVDVLLDGRISELATKRSEYSSVLQNHGIEQLIDSLKQKSAQLATQ